ncbi:hypothetical protein [Lysobacter enzymogenes]|uniref:hypothetical protein n=1 Tax=Lysobacter enzymogenes TaxID=69 RepID=UPI000943D36C
MARALADDDLDAAIALGLLDADFDRTCVCIACAPECAQRSRDARQARLRALAARERYRARDRRLQRRAEERAAQRAAPALPAAAIEQTSIGEVAAETATAGNAAAAPNIAAETAPRPALPSAAAAALARAKAKAAQRGTP